MLDASSLSVVFAFGFAAPIIVLTVPYLIVYACMAAWHAFAES